MFTNEKKEKMRYALDGLAKSVLAPIIRNYTYTIEYGGIDVKLRGGLRFLGFIRRTEAEEHFLSNLDLNGKTIYDIGSHIGIWTIFFAKSSAKAGQVIAFEPNPETYAKLRTNVDLNGINNVKILAIGIGDRQVKKTLVVRHHNSGTGTMDEKMQAHILKERGSRSLQVDVDTLDGCIEAYNLPKPDFIKIDIEGMEYYALLGMSETISKFNPKLFIEIHGADKNRKIDNIRRIVEYLDIHGYSVYHVESEQTITNENAQIANEGHIFCENLH